MSKHTSGPWEVTQYGRLVYADRDGDAECPSIADVDGDSPEADANARLIAAAPDLLAVCELVLARLDYLQSLWGKEGVTDAVVQTIREAVIKANGGDQ